MSWNSKVYVCIPFLCIRYVVLLTLQKNFLLPTQRRCLYSFLCAYAPNFYLTSFRNWLLDLLDLPASSDARIERRH